MQLIVVGTQAVFFFYLLQNIYTFFIASTHLQSLNKNWSLIIDALNLIKNYHSEKTLTRNEAREIFSQLKNLESAFLSIFWGQILHRFNLTSKKLQSVNIDLGVECELCINH